MYPGYKNIQNDKNIFMTCNKYRNDRKTILILTTKHNTSDI